MKTDKRLQLEIKIEEWLDSDAVIEEPETLLPEDCVERLADAVENVYDAWASLTDYLKTEE